MPKPTIGFAMCGSFCTFRKTIDVLRTLAVQYHIIPILSGASYETDSRFGAAADFRAEIEAICGEPVFHTLPEVEPFGPKATLDLLVIAPCTHAFASQSSYFCGEYRQAAEPQTLLFRSLRTGQSGKEALQSGRGLYPPAGNGRRRAGKPADTTHFAVKTRVPPQSGGTLRLLFRPSSLPCRPPAPA